MSPAAPPETSLAADAQERLRAALVEVGVGAGLIDDLVKASLACAAVETGARAEESLSTLEEGVTQVGAAAGAQARARQMLTAVEAVTLLSTRMDGVRLAATRQLTAEMGKVLLAAKDVSGPTELSKTARKSWRAEAKRVTRHEIEAAIGWGSGDVITLVGLANAPASVRGPVHQGLARGEVSWPLVSAYFRATSAMDHEDGSAIANGLFGDDPEESVTERVTRQGEWLGGPWRVKEFHRVLKREVHKIKNQDPDAAKEARRAAQYASDVRINVDAEGTAEVVIGTRTAQAAAVADRIERAAKAARQGGDLRTLRQLRSAVAMSLLLHGTLDFTGISEDPNTITVEQSDQLTKLLYGLPTADLQVVLPLQALFGQDVTGAELAALLNSTADLSRCGHSSDADGVNAPPDTPGNRRSDPDAGRDVGAVPDPDPGAHAGAVPDPDPGAHAGAVPDPDPGAHAGAVTDADRHDYARPRAVGEIIGKRSAFLGSDELWELMLTPGSTLYRLLVDPVSGRCMEKSAKGYRFTASQRAQIVASDGFCRAPGCLVPAWLCQVDHVQEYGTVGGDTAEANGQSVSNPHHDLKTRKLWDAVMNSHRDVTWTTLLGRVYTTKAHDYTQYTKLLTAAKQYVDAPECADTAQGVADGAASGLGGHAVVQEATDDWADRVDRAIYQALSYRPPGADLLARDDWDEDTFHGWPLITLTHRDANGRRIWKPDPATVTAARAAHKAARTDDASDHSADAETTAGPPPEDIENSTDAERQHEGHGAPEGTLPWAAGDDDAPPF
ncbi:HNH endonuclease [Ornithinimicrobium ciconiae]|uniref:HNH endonuclease n=1 Tax=Ornithinimicrobium ciconiae TaxID=2594265 RepID=A0A516GBA7_9MICO|nr:HNH endonuclease signature motif containing protein [Ornithinimicrobium ciconiae]QDO88778.1 HNH endonuclease [Ornithinimicrobium ciconiae]